MMSGPWAYGHVNTPSITSPSITLPHLPRDLPHVESGPGRLPIDHVDEGAGKTPDVTQRALVPPFPVVELFRGHIAHCAHNNLMESVG